MGDRGEPELTPEEALDDIENALAQTDVFDEHFEVLRELIARMRGLEK